MTTLRLLRGGLVDDEGPLHARGGAHAPLARTTTRGPVHVRDFLRAADDATEWRPRQGELIVLVLYRFGPGAEGDVPSTATLHAIAGQVSRTVRRSDVADAYAPSTIGVLLTGVRDVPAAMETALQVRGLVDEHPLLPVESCVVVGQGMGLILPGSDASVLMAQAEAALDESVGSDADSLSARLVLPDADGRLRTTSFTTALARRPGIAPDQVWTALGAPVADPDRTV